MSLKMWHLLIDDKNTYFNRYLELIKLTIDQQTSEYNTEEERVKKIDPQLIKDEPYSINDYLGDLSYEHDQLNDLLLKSFVVSVLIFIEGQTALLCNHLHKLHKEKFSYKDLKGTGITRCINYLKRVTSIEFPHDKNLSLDLDIARIIRNAIVHSDGKIFDNDLSKLKEYATDNSSVIINNDCSVTITSDYCNKLIKLNKKMMVEISNLWVVPLDLSIKSNNDVSTI